uniref:Zinc finger protein 92 n=4 Tax=Lygus hesperus TaxID=30085 RepID=A0A146LZB2_LYGHE
MESSSHLVSDSSEYTEHFLAQLTADPLVLSSSQVSSVLSELEPSRSPAVHPDLLTIAKVVGAVGSTVLPPPPPPPIPPLVPPPPTNKRYHAVKCVKVTLGELSWYRCSLCPFLATSQDLISSHYINLHVDSVAAELRCLTCEVSFSRLQNLKHHYVIDHLVSLSDLQNLTKLTVKANEAWRNKNKHGKEDCSMVDSIVPEIVTAEELFLDDEQMCESTRKTVTVRSLSSPPSPSAVAADPASPSTPSILSFVINKFPERGTAVDVGGTGDDVEERLREEEARKAEIKAEKEEKAIWKCTVEGCSLKFITEGNLDYHKMCHEGDSSQWKCPECGEVFTKWSELSLHLWRSHVLDIDLYSCDLCDFKTNNLSKLMNVHRRIHGSDRPYLCDTCGKGFKTIKQLATHKALHNKSKKPVVQGSENCRICSRMFTDPRLLRHHMDIVHRGLRPYVCNVCSYSASSMSTLKMHLRSHTGEKPYACPYCRYKTADHNSLRRHKMRHSGAKHYKCPHCSYASIQSTTYKDHLKNKHPGLDDGLMFCCNYCSFRTVNNKIFLTHISSHSFPINEKSQGDSKMSNGETDATSE